MTNSERTVEINLGSNAVPGDGRVTTDVIEDSNKIVGSTIGGDSQRQDQVTDTDISEEMNLCGGSQHLKRNCPLKKKITENSNVIRVCSTNTIKCLNAEIILHGNRCVRLIDSGSSISILSWSTYEKLGKPGIVQTYTKRVLTANNSAVKIIGRVTLLVQLQPRISEVEQEFVITVDEGIECLLGINFLKTNKCALNLHEEKLYSSHFNISIPLTTEKTRGVQVFAVAGQNTYIQRTKV